MIIFGTRIVDEKVLGKSGIYLGRKCVYHDNESVMKLEKNAYESRGKKSCHISIRFFSSRIY